MAIDSQTGAKIKELRDKLGLNQVQFAGKVGVTQPTISSWEAGDKDRAPSSEALMKLGNLAPYPDCIWFWSQAGMDGQAILSTAEKLLKERSAPPVEGEIFRVPCIRRVGQKEEQTGETFPFPLNSLLYPRWARCLVVDENSASPWVLSGGRVVFDTPEANSEDTLSFQDEIVAVDRDAEVSQARIGPEIWTGWQGGLLIGRLRFKRYSRPLHMPGLQHGSHQEMRVATVGSLGDNQLDWEPRGESILVGESQLPARRGRVTGPGIPYQEEDVRVFSEAEKVANMRLYPGYHILGIVRGLFPAPVAKANE